MKIETRLVEVIDQEDIWQIKLFNDKGICASFLSLGATWQEFLVPQADGGLKNLVLGHDQPSAYLDNGICAGQTVGRVAGRIKAGQFTLNGSNHQLPTNNNGNTLHGGPQGLHRQNWAHELLEKEDRVGVRFTYRAKEAVDGFPGDVTISALYELDNHNRLTLTYEGADATADTLFNPANHVYFNLGQQDNLARHTLFLAANHRLETDEDLIPTGQRLEVTGTAYDFRRATSVVEAIALTGGLDDAFELAVSASHPAAILTDQVSGDQMTIYTDRNALVVYSFNWPEEGVVFSRSQGRENRQHEGLALEAQTLPDAINHSDFGNIVLKQGQNKTYKMVYEYDRLSEAQS